MFTWFCLSVQLKARNIRGLPVFYPKDGEDSELIVGKLHTLKLDALAKEVVCCGEGVLQSQKLFVVGGFQMFNSKDLLHPLQAEHLPLGTSFQLNTLGKDRNRQLVLISPYCNVHVEELKLEFNKAANLEFGPLALANNFV